MRVCHLCAAEGLNGTLHDYKWSRCTTLPSECGYGPYPRDPGMFTIPGTGKGDIPVSVVYGMQKTCSDSGREFYAIGQRDPSNNNFVLFDNTSDMANNVFDGGDGYASMTVFDPIHQRVILSITIIEGDRYVTVALRHRAQVAGAHLVHTI